jgi:hypothetical protein
MPDAAALFSNYNAHVFLSMASLGKLFERAVPTPVLRIGSAA